MESLIWMLLAVFAGIAVFVGTPKLIGLWYTRHAWRLSGADLASKFNGLIEFGLDGSFLALLPVSKPGVVI